MNKIKYLVALFFILSSGAASAGPFAGGDQGLSTKGMFKSNLNQKDMKIVEMQGDEVNYSAANNTAAAKGNVVLTSGETTLTADQVQLDRNRQEGMAEGHVYIDSPSQQVDADEAKYNFNDQSGSFKNARIYTFPYGVSGEKVERLSPEHISMENGYMTTSDYDDPFFKIVAKKMDVYPGDKAIVRGMKIYLGKIPVFYWPKYVQDLKDKPWITFVPGKTKDFGIFLYSTIRLKVTEDSRLTLHMDYRERKDFASGFDYKYDTKHYGGGIVRTYYMDERDITAKHLWITNPDESIKGHERYMAEWRHKWTPDQNTDILVQYFRMRDPNFLKDYFPNQYRTDSNIDTYFLLTRTLPRGSLSFNVDASRVNRYARGVEKFPEIRYELGDTEIGSTGFYGQTTTTFSNLDNKAPEEPENHLKTMRFDTNNRISYPMKIAFVEFKPYAGGEDTYYSRTADLSRQNIIRNAFFTGADASTQFYRIWNVHQNLWGTQINGLRHVVTPSVAYFYETRPTTPATSLNQFDSIDALQNSHKIGLSLENKLQTKDKDKKSLDLVRTLVSSDFALKENPSRGGFGPVNSEIEIKPNQWLEFRADTSYDHYNDRMESANFDAYINSGNKWSFDISRRYAHGEDDLVTTEWDYIVNPKWKMKVFDKFAINTGSLKEEDYVLTRDLHEWEAALEYHQLRGGGVDLLLTFTLKAFPKTNLDLFSTGFHKRKAGSQSAEEIQ